MRDYDVEFKNRVTFIRQTLEEAGCESIVYGNSGGKDSALVGILCRAACGNVLGVMMPCQSVRNFGSDMEDARALAAQFDIALVTVDLSSAKQMLLDAVGGSVPVSEQAQVNIAPRLRMATLYAIAQTQGALVAGTGNRSEAYMGYFTKYGDGAYDFNPIADLTASEVFEFLKHLNAPLSIVQKAPSAGLYEGQTDEQEMGVSYAEIDEYMNTGKGDPASMAIIEKAHKLSEHKRKLPKVYDAQS